jgi:hypothetical protein
LETVFYGIAKNFVGETFHQKDKSIIFVHVQELERQQRERNCIYLAKILNSMKNVTYRTTWAEVHVI